MRQISALVNLNQTLPTYLKEFLCEDFKCQLIHKKASSVSSSSSGDTSIDTSISCSELELTGNPLEVDLDNSLMTAVSSELETAPPNWTNAESQHIPMTLEESRDYLNMHINLKVGPTPTFCVTNGRDKQRVVVNGSQRRPEGFTTYMVKILGLLNENALSLSFFEKEHRRHVRVKADSTVYNFQRIYNIYGFDLLETINSQSAPSNGCVILKNIWHTQESEELAAIQTKIVLKVISGHKKSSIHFLWRQLIILRNLLKIEEDSSVTGVTVMSSDNLTSRELSNEIRELCRSHSSIEKFQLSEGLNLNNLREETILDKLWHLLIRCRNLEDLKYSICLFITIVKPANFDESDHILADIVNNCAKRNDFEEKLTFLECLNLLLFIGFEKLKRDYFTLTSYYYPMFQEQLQLQWSNLKSFNEKSKGITKIDSKCNRKIFEFIVDLHDVSEMLVFSKQDVKNLLELSSDNWNRIFESIFDKYMFNKDEKKVDAENKLLESCCDLNFAESLYKRKKPVTSIYEYVSQVNVSNVRTIFHVSQNTIFPKCIYDDYETDATLDESSDQIREDQYYVSVLIEAKHNIFLAS